VSFDTVVGQKHPKGILAGALARGTVASSYLFYGPRGVGKLALAVELAKAVNCQKAEPQPCNHCSACRRIGELNYPDVSLIFPTPKKIKPEEHQEMLRQRAANLYHTPRLKDSASISIETIRKIQTEASYKSYEGKMKVFILADADKLTLSAANAMLKILEEPPPHVLFILTTVQPSKLPVTVLSRCQQIRFSRLSEAEVGHALEKTQQVDPDRKRLVSKLAQGDLGLARELLHEDVNRRRCSTLNALTKALSCNLTSLIKLAENLGRFRSRSVSEENLEMLQIWYRDLLLLLEDKEEFLINEDLRPQLEEMARQYNWEGVQRSLRFIQETLKALAANVNLELAWLVLFFKLRRQRRVST
jgi:DNA polymerase-3 subunit delta'